MKTDDLIAMLARGEAAVAPRAAQRRYAAALAAGVAGAAILLTAIGTCPDLAQALYLPMFWGKSGFTAAVAAAGLLLVVRLSSPGAALGLAPLALAVPFVAVWAAAGVTLASADANPATLFLGETWYSCPALAALLSAPALVVVLWAMKGLAPTRLRLAGAATGVLAGGIGATLYSLHCIEMTAPYIGVWYVLGIALPVLAGALLGPRLLRW
jgi:hypothetical protein